MMIVGKYCTKHIGQVLAAYILVLVFMAFVSHTVAVMVVITCFSLIFLSTKYIPVSPLAEDCSTPNQVSLLFLKTVDEDVVVSPQPVDC